MQLRWITETHESAGSGCGQVSGYFLHQLMKYEKFRPLYSKLHLPLDGIVFKALTQYKGQALSSVQYIFRKPPYSIEYMKYVQVQNALSQLVLELNSKVDGGYRLQGRIDLNVLLWAS